MKNDLTVVIVNDFDYVQGGASKVAIDTAKILHENGIRTIFFSATHQENNYQFEQVCTNQKECLKDGIRGAFRGLSNAKVKHEFSNLLNSLDKEKTIIHVHGWTKSLSNVIFKVIKKKKFKMVLTVHDYFLSCPNGGFFNYKQNRICKLEPMSLKCKKCNCDSRNYLFKLYRIVRQFIQNKNVKNLNGNCIYISDFSHSIIKNSIIKNWNYRRIDNPIDFSKEEFKNSKENELYVFLGRISKEKGIDLFCEAVTKCNLKSMVIGDGPEKHRLQEKYPNINFVGWKNSSEIKNLLKKTRVLIFPSLWYETAGLTAIEAQTMGIPVLVGDKCATSDYVTDNVNGLIYKMGDVDDLIEKLKKCNDQTISKLSKNAYELYWANAYNIQKYFNQILEYYHSIIKNEF